MLVIYYIIYHIRHNCVSNMMVMIAMTPIILGAEVKKH